LEVLAAEEVGIFYGRFVYFTAIWYILWILRLFGIFYPVLVRCTKKNLATLLRLQRGSDGFIHFFHSSTCFHFPWLLLL
jgi:hypothetical protein